MVQDETWLDQHKYRWIKEHLLHRPGDRLLYTALAAGMPETPPPARWAPTIRELMQQQDTQEGEDA